MIIRSKPVPFSLGNVLNENPFYLGFALLDDVIVPKLDYFPQY